MAIDEDQLIEEAKTDPEAFGKLYEIYVEKIYNYVYYRIGNQQEAEDLTAKVFHRALNHIPNYNNKGVPFAAWLYRIAHNLVANWHRDRKRRKVVALEKVTLSGDKQGNPQHAAERTNERELLLAAIQKLPPERQNLLTLKFVERMSNAEIGQVMGRSEGAIKSLYHRTLVSLKSYWLSTKIWLLAHFKQTTTQVIKIVTDSTCDMPANWANQYNITIVPVNIQFGLETFKEGVTIKPNTFYKRISADGVLPTTSQPSVGEFIEVYKKLSADGSEILSVHLTSKLSGTWQSAVMAAKQLEGQIKVSVVDSLTGSVGLGLMIREAAQLVELGLTVDEIVTRLEARRTQINVFILLKDLRYARMSGRVGRIRETLASLLHVKPIVGVDDGALIPLARVRGQKKGFEQMLALAEEMAGDVPVYVGMTHAIDQPQAQILLAQVKERLNCRDTFTTDLALSLAVHFGPGTIGFATYPAE